MIILEQKRNPLLHREELVITIESESIPSKSEVKKKISEKLSDAMGKAIQTAIENIKGSI